MAWPRLVSWFFCSLVVEEPHAGEAHGDAILVGRLDHVVVADGAAGLCDELDARLVGALDVVAKREERIRAHGHAGLRGNPLGLLLAGEDLGLLGEPLLPLAFGQHVVVLLGDVDVDGVVAVGAADALDELEAQHLRVLTQVPGVSLVASEAGAVHAALLTGTHADGLAVLDVADAVGLRVLEGDERDDHVTDGALGNVLALGHEVADQLGVDLVEVVALLKGDTKDVLGLDGGALIGRVDLHDVVVAALLLGEDGQGLLGVTGGDDAVGDLGLEVAGHVGVADVRECGPVTIGAHAVSAAGTDVGAGDGRGIGHGVGHKVDLTVDVRKRCAHGGASGRDMLEAGSAGKASSSLEVAHELPRVERVEEVDETRLALQYLDNFGFSTLAHGTDADTDANGNVYTDANLPMALGGLTYGITNIDLCAAYATIANSGNYIKPVYYTKILDHNGNVLIENTSAEKSVIKESTAFLLTSAMEDVVQQGTGTACQLDNMAVAGKTGTTDQYNDLWFAGFTPYYTCVVWSGYDDNQKIPDDARNFHKNLWRKVMSRIHEGLEYRDFQQPSSVEKISICSETGLLPRTGCPVIEEYFDVGTVPTEYCDQHFYEVPDEETEGELILDPDLTQIPEDPNNPVTPDDPVIPDNPDNTGGDGTGGDNTGGDGTGGDGTGGDTTGGDGTGGDYTGGNTTGDGTDDIVYY